MKDVRDAQQHLEEVIRADQQKRNARTLLEALPNAGRSAQQGLWLAATILDPSITDEY